MEGVTINLQGDPSLSKISVSLKSIWKAFKEHEEGLLLELKIITVSPIPSLHRLPAIIEELLEEIKAIFEDITQLSPRRRQDHAIILNQGLNQ